MSLSITVEDPASADAAVLLQELSSTLAAITGRSGKASFEAIYAGRPEAACFEKQLIQD